MTPRPDRDHDREQARLQRVEKARLAREATARAERRRRVLVLGSLGIVAVLLVGLVAGVIISANRSARDAATTAPIGASADRGVVVGSADAPGKVVIYLDYQCPFCQQLETETGPWLEQQVAAGDISVEYHVVSFLDGISEGYSTRAANAAACVADDPAADYATFNDAMFAQQPEENGSGLPDSTLVQIAERAGAGKDVSTCISTSTYVPWVEHMTDEWRDAGYQGTPTVLVNGNLVTGANGALPGETEIEAALAS